MNPTQSTTAEAAVAAAQRVTFEWGRLHSLTAWWHWALLIGVCLGVLWFVALMYRRDSAELHPAVGWLLTTLRLLALLGLLIIYLQPQWRTDVDHVVNSRALVLVDTSLSMGLDDDDSAPRSASGQTAPKRADLVADALGRRGLIDQLRQRHDVQVLRFDSELARIGSFGKQGTANDAAGNSETKANPTDSRQPSDAGKTPTPAVAEVPVDWAAQVKPRGTETRLGQSLRQLINDERSNPVAGVILITDGGQNAGVEPAIAAQIAREAKIALFPIGVGSNRRPTNVRVADLLAPARAYPGDSYTVTGFVQSQGLAGQSVVVELLSRPAETGPAATAPAADPGTVLASQELTLGGDGEMVTIKFDVKPEETGRRALSLRVVPPAGDGNSNDNLFGPVDIEIVDRRTKVLLFAGGPSRDYIYLRNLLHRDRQMEVDVLLQTAQPGISQDASKILDEFPVTREELFAYDCIVAFDPDWQELDADQIDLVERWVAEQAGGLIVIPGPIHTDSWAQRANMQKIRALYPVEFHKRFSLLDDARFGSKDPWPIDFTREGMEAEFLWLRDTAAQSQQAWADFPGVYGYYSIKGPKPGATVYGTYSDPRAAADGQPVYLASQFFGSGRVFYMGSAEIWRLQRLEVGYLEQFYTKLVRYVSQGRLLRGSNRGVLLVEQDRYLLGNSVAVRAQLNNAQLEPLVAPSVLLEVISPSGELQNVTLQPIATTPGTFGGQFNVYQEGTYRLELPVPESADERLSRRILVKVPDRERENPQRNDALLTELAQTTGGEYFIGFDKALGVGSQGDIVKRLPDRQQILTLTNRPETLWDNQYVMYAICGILCLEWLIRRFVKLA